MKYICLIIILIFSLCFVSCKKQEDLKSKTASILDDPEVQKLINDAPSSPTTVPKGYKILDLIGIDFDYDGEIEYAVLGKKTEDNKRKRAADVILWIEKDGKIYWECKDILNEKAVMDSQSISQRPYYELVVTVPIDEKKDFFNVFVYGFEKKRSGQEEFDRLFRFSGSKKAGDSVAITDINGNPVLVTISSVSKDGDLYSGEATRFISTNWTWKGNGFVKGKEKITKNKYSENSEIPNGFYEELGINSSELISLKTFDEDEAEP